MQAESNKCYMSGFIANQIEFLIVETKEMAIQLNRYFGWRYVPFGQVYKFPDVRISTEFPTSVKHYAEFLRGYYEAEPTGCAGRIFIYDIGHIEPLTNIFRHLGLNVSFKFDPFNVCYRVDFLDIPRLRQLFYSETPEIFNLKRIKELME